MHQNCSKNSETATIANAILANFMNDAGVAKRYPKQCWEVFGKKIHFVGSARLHASKSIKKFEIEKEVQDRARFERRIFEPAPFLEPPKNTNCNY